MLVSHSQGGLVVQRYLARMLNNARGNSLARIRRIVMFACPNSGSELGLTLRRHLFSRNPQERDLRPVNESITEAQRTVLNRVVHATDITPESCPIAIVAYAGESDNIVTPTSAKSIFPHAGVLPGDHFSIIRPDSSRHCSYTTLKWNLLEVLRGGSAPSPTEGAPTVELAGHAVNELIYNSDTEFKPFDSWTYFAERGVRREKFPHGTGRVIGMQSHDGEAIGVNKSFPLLAGVIEFEYQIGGFDQVVQQVYFAVIPMEETGIGRSGLIELGGTVEGDPKNAQSPFRRRHFVPPAHYHDGACTPTGYTSTSRTWIAYFTAFSRRESTKA